MLEKWTGEVVGDMHIYNITGKEIAEEMGVTAEYVSMILNGKKRPKNAETSFKNAVQKIKSRRF